MKFTITREHLLAPLQQIVRVIIEKKHTTPILSNVLVRCRDQTLILTGTDTEIQIVSQLTLADIHEESDGRVAEHPHNDKIRQQYFLYEPDVLSFSAGHISYRNILPDEFVLVMDLHSHGNLSAFFSKTVDQSDLGGFYIAAVVGNCDSGEPTFSTRMAVNGHFFECWDFRNFFCKKGMRR